MRPILPNLFFESIYLGMVSSVGSAAGTPRLSIVPPANQGSIVHGEKAAIHSPISHIAPPTSSVGPRIVIWLPVERFVSILPALHHQACCKVKFATTRSSWRRVANNEREHVVPLSDAAKTIIPVRWPPVCVWSA